MKGRVVNSILNLSDLYGHRPGSTAPGAPPPTTLSGASGLSSAPATAATAPITALLLMLGVLVAVRVLWEMAD
jgi:hypothetical protein